MSIDCIHWRPNENRRKRREKNVHSSFGRQLICPSSVYCCKCQVLKELLQLTLGLQGARECVIFHTPLLSRWEGPVDFHSGERRFTFSSHTPSVPYEFSSVSVTLTKASALSLNLQLRINVRIHQESVCLMCKTEKKCNFS